MCTRIYGHYHDSIAIKFNLIDAHMHTGLEKSRFFSKKNQKHRLNRLNRLNRGFNRWKRCWLISLPDEAFPGDWLGLRSQADLNSPINDSSLCSLSKWFLKMFSDDEQTMSLSSLCKSAASTLSHGRHHFQLIVILAVNHYVLLPALLRADDNYFPRHSCVCLSVCMSHSGRS